MKSTATIPASPAVTIMKRCFALAALVFATIAAYAQASSTGSVTGRVLNVTSGSFLNNARVVVAGTRLETFTNESGEFRLTEVPAGEVQLAVTFTGLQPQTAMVRIAAGEAATQDFNLTRIDAGSDVGVVKLSEFVVASSREMNAADIAINEQRYAANIKNVVDADAFGDAGEGNLGEFIKFIPGVTVNYSSFDARSISVRGMPSSTTPVMVDGNRMASAASSGVTREVEVGGLTMNNISRVEVSKTPTPDSPADSMGGSVNVVSKGAFDRLRPQFTYRASAIMNSNWLTLKKMPGAQPKSTGRRVLPGLDFSYIAPFSKTFGITVNGFYTQRFSGTQMTQPIWRPINGATSSFGTAENPFLSGHTVRDQPTWWQRYSIGTTADWKVGPFGMLSVSTQFTTAAMHQVIEQWTTSLTGTSTTRPAGYDATFALSAPGAASSVLSTNGRIKTDRTWHSSVQYRHNGPVWKFDGGGFYSHSTNTYRDIDDGFFSGVTTRVRSLTLRYGDIGTVRKGPGTIAATTTAGVPVDLFSLAPYSIASVGSNQLSSADTIVGAHLNVRREFKLGVPIYVRSGLDVRRQDRDIRQINPTWTFLGPDGVATTADDLSSRYDIIDPVYSSANAPFDLPPLQRPSPYKLWQLYQTNPEYFRFEEANFINTSSAASRKLTETVSAGYVRGDLRLLNHRLWLVGGVRFERTEDEGYGRLSDIRATYQQDASGNLIRDAAGRPIRVSTNAVEIARLQYKERGAHATRAYGNFYPSLNATYNLTSNFQARVAFARTIGRPNLNEIIPNITITDPASAEANRTITIVNTGLKPWSADNFDLSLEYYFPKSGRVAVGGFQKNIKNFFGTVRVPATPEQLAEFGLNEDYLDYEIITKLNVGDAQVSGLDFDYQQPLTFLPPWARGILVFFNVTKTHLEGSSTANFSGFTRESTNWGLSLIRPRYTIKLTWNYRGRQRLAAITGTGVPPGSYVYNPEYLTLNVNAEYRISRRLAFWALARNIANRPLIEERYGSITPTYARISNYQNLGSQISVGLKGEW
ncbi:MAG: TonB-dependent receptor [Opitutaceae bacterium]|nr:TonB-dependent receptor [Opitutaceae bacterium]